MPGIEYAMATTTRKLAAIMFTDIVGYTALMGKDEDKAFSLLRKNREIHSRFINQFHGTLIKEMGDGMLISFDLASNAVRCAIQIQKASIDQSVPLKIGIHEGEMVFEGTDVLGDGVNIASRIQDGCANGCILISGSVFRDIKNKSDIQTEFLSERYFKNVDEKIRIYSVTIGDRGSKLPDSKTEIPRATNKIYWSLGLIMIIVMTILWWNYGRSTTNTEQRDSIDEREKSIAVVLFHNLSGDASNDYKCESLTDEIITNLFFIKSFDKVVPFLSTYAYKNSTKTVNAIAEELGVVYILSGSYKEIGDELIIHATLTEASNNKQIWANKYIKSVEDIFSVQSDIPIKICDAIDVFLSQNEINRIDDKPTISLEAYNYYQRSVEFKKLFGGGRYYNKQIGDSIKFWLNRAIILDSNFAHAFGLLGLFHMVDGTSWGELPIREAAKNANFYINRALEIDPEEYWALFASALVNLYDNWNYIEAESNYLKLIEIMPNDLKFISQFSEFLYQMGRPLDALEFIDFLNRKGFEFDVTNNVYGTHIRSLIKLGRLTEASAVNQQYLQSDDYVCDAAKYHLCLQQYDSALYYLDDAYKNNHPLMQLHLNQINYALALYKCGNTTRALQIIDDLKTWSQGKDYRESVLFASFYSQINEIDSAFIWLNHAYQYGGTGISWIKAEESLEPIRDDPRYWDLYEKTGHAEYDRYLQMKNGESTD